jgi:hypothetical protein
VVATKLEAVRRALELKREGRNVLIRDEKWARIRRLRFILLRPAAVNKALRGGYGSWGRLLRGYGNWTTALAESSCARIAGDVLAVRMVMAHVLGRICQLDPILAEAIHGGFEDAVDQIRKTATKSRERLTSHQAVEALVAVEALRAVMTNSSGNGARRSVANDSK